MIFMALYLGIDSCIKDVGIRKNVSESLPFSYFLSTKLGEIKREMYVALEHPKSSFLLAKQVIGLPGDEITIRNQILYINDIACGVIQKKNRSNQPIDPIQEGKIPDGYLFVYALHPDSYDSRYADFGLVAISQLKEKLWPLF
jgi:conjugal transfer pilin signal peptidase TrbI